MITDFVLSLYTNKSLCFKIIRISIEEETFPINLNDSYSESEIEINRLNFTINKERINELILDFFGCIDGDLR